MLAVFPRDPQVNSTNKAATEEPKIQQAFSSQVTLKTWNEFITDGAVKLGETELREDAIEPQQAHLRSLITAGTLLPVLVERQSSLAVISANDAFRVGDRLIYLLHDSKPKLLKLLSGSSQAHLTLEKLPEVEKIPFLVDGDDRSFMLV